MFEYMPKYFCWPKLKIKHGQPTWQLQEEAAGKCFTWQRITAFGSSHHCRYLGLSEALIATMFYIWRAYFSQRSVATVSSQLCLLSAAIFEFWGMGNASCSECGCCLSLPGAVITQSVLQLTCSWTALILFVTPRHKQKRPSAISMFFQNKGRFFMSFLITLGNNLIKGIG